MSGFKPMRIFNRLEFESNSYSFIGIQAIGLMIALLMWSISIFGLHSDLNTRSISIMVVCISLFVLIFYFLFREKKLGHINLVSILLPCIGLIQISAYYYVFNFPPFVWDEVAYNAALPKLYAVKKYFYYAAEYGPYSAFPQNFEAISTASLLLFNSFAFAKFLNFIFALGILVVAGNIGLLIGLPRVFAILGGSAIGLSSEFIVFTPVLKNDVANGFFQSAAIMMVILYSKNNTLKNCCLMGVFIGTAIGIKYNSLLFSLCPILLFLWITLVSEDLWLTKLRKIFFTGLTVLIISLPWYSNNFYLFNNPVYPIANDFFGPVNEFHSGYSQLFRESFYSDVNFSWKNGSVLAFFKRFSSEFSPVIVIFGLIGVIKNLLYYKNKQELYLAIVTIGALGLTIRLGFWEPRYSFVILIMLSTQFASFMYFMATLALKFKPIKKTIFIISVICIVCCMVFGYIRGLKIYGEQSRYFQTHSKESFLLKYVAGYGIADWLNKNTPKDSVVAVWGYQMFYYLDRPYFHIHPLTESGNLLGVDDGMQFYDFLTNKNISYLCLADWRFDKIPDRSPGLKSFFLELNGWVKELELRGDITQVAVIDKARIYKLNKK